MIFMFEGTIQRSYSRFSPFHSDSKKIGIVLQEKKSITALGKQLNRRYGASTTSAAADSEKIHRVFVVGCGHSGTSLLLRTLANMRGVYCIPRETNIFNKPRISTIRAIQTWDQQAKGGNFTHWAEKTPRVGCACDSTHVFPSVHLFI